MKKTLALLLALVMVLALAACGQSAAPAATQAPAEAAHTQRTSGLGNTGCLSRTVESFAGQAGRDKVDRVGENVRVSLA